MAKKKSVASSSLFSKIAAATGGLTLDVAGNVPYHINTGNLALNFICSGKFINGGIPGGRITEVYGPPSTAKSLLGYCALASCQQMGGVAILLDCERASSADFAKTAGHVKTEELIVYEPISIEQVQARIIASTKAIREHYPTEVPILYIWDSITVTPTEREWAEIDLPENATKAQIKAAGGNERPGERARACGDLLRKINPFMDENNATLFIVNQTRVDIGKFSPAGIVPETTGGGGKALPFYASTRLRTSIQKNIENDQGLPIGINLGFQNKKSRSCAPGMRTVGVQLFYEAGINPIGGIMSLLLSTKRVEVCGKSRYKVAAAYSNGEEVTFTTAVSTRNDLPIDILYKCPKLIDAETEEEVRTYFAQYQSALDLAFDVKTVEKIATSDDSEDLESDLDKVLNNSSTGDDEE
jgi:RecA/RadA recombinase